MYFSAFSVQQSTSDIWQAALELLIELSRIAGDADFNSLCKIILLYFYLDVEKNHSSCIFYDQPYGYFKEKYLLSLKSLNDFLSVP